MQIHYENDTQNGAGFGLFHIHSVNIPPSSPIHFCIQRSSDSKYLGDAGWFDAEKRLSPHNITHHNSTCTLHIPPATINHLDILETYRFTLVAENIQEHAILSIDHIIYGDMSQEQHGHVHTEKTPSPPEPSPEIAPPAVEEHATSAALATQLDPPAQISQSPSTTKIILIVLGILLALGILGMIIMMLSKEPSTDPKAPDKEAVQQETPKEAGEETPKESPAEVPQTSATPLLRPKVQVNNFVNQQGTPDEALALALAMPASEEGLDARFLLLEISAEGENTEAMLLVAEIYDPTHNVPIGTIIKDAEQALYWYDKALGSPNITTEQRKQAEDAKIKLSTWLDDNKTNTP